MDKAAKVRWTVLLSALAATIAAIVYPVDEPPQQPAPRVAVKKASMPIVPGPAVHERERSIWIASDEDPFAPRAWVAPPLPVAPAQPPAPVAQAPAPAPLVEQRLPYRFLGEMQDGNMRVVYLGRGDQMLLARLGDVLENAYKVVAIGDGQVEFESVQSGIRQTLAAPAQ